MNYCPRCGSPLIAGQNFCRRCGFDVRERPVDYVAPAPALPVVRGIGRNSVVYVTHQGLVGTKIQSDFKLFLAFALPGPALLVIYAMTLSVALAVIATVWLAVAMLGYDELRARGLRGLKDFDPEATNPGRASWLIPWRFVRMADWNGRTLWFSGVEPSRKASVTFDKGDAPMVERTLSSWGVRYAWRPPRLPPRISGFWSLVIIFFVVSQMIMILAATLPFFPGEQQVYNTILSGTRSQIAGASFLQELREIYLNNIQVATGGALPFLGTLTFGVASYNTGRVIQVIAIGDHVSPVAVLVSLYILPHTWVEELSYPMAAVAGLLAVTRWDSVSPGEFARRRNRASGKFLLALGGVALTLLVAALLETTTTYLGLLAVMLWIPLFFAYYFIRSGWQRGETEDTTTRFPPSIAPSPTETGREGTARASRRRGRRQGPRPSHRLPSPSGREAKPVSPLTSGRPDSKV